jgi:hypothetical protein
LLLAYPAEFRDEYAEEMERLFAERLAAEPPIGICMAALADVAIAAPREHLHILAGDLRHSLRIFAKAPGFVCAALLALALGVSASTTIFSWKDDVGASLNAGLDASRGNPVSGKARIEAGKRIRSARLRMCKTRLRRRFIHGASGGCKVRVKPGSHHRPSC